MHFISSFFGVPIGKILFETVFVVEVFFVVLERAGLISIPGSTLTLEDRDVLLAAVLVVAGLVVLVEPERDLLDEEAVVLLVVADERVDLPVVDRAVVVVTRTC